MLNILIFGGPGSGKGTQSDRITEKYQLKHLSTGELLRAEIANGSELGKQAKKYMEAGSLVPDDMIVRILSNAIDTFKGYKGLIFDGFPRNVAQASILDEMLAERGQKVTVLLDLSVSDEALVERMLSRSRVSGRADDNPETIAKRVKVYHEVTAPCIDYYKAKGVYARIDGSGSIDQTASYIAACLDKILGR